MLIKDEPQPFCLGVVSDVEFEVQHHLQCATGEAKKKDKVIRIRKLEPVVAGGSVFEVTGRFLNVHSHFVRMRQVETEDERRTVLDGVLSKDQTKQTGSYTEGQKVSISDETKAALWSSVPAA